MVADEVRSLALRSKEAAQRTEELIRQAVGEAAAGESTARGVNAKLTEIVGGVTQLSDVVAEIRPTRRNRLRASSRSRRPSPR